MTLWVAISRSAGLCPWQRLLWPAMSQNHVLLMKSDLRWGPSLLVAYTSPLQSTALQWATDSKSCIRKLSIWFPVFDGFFYFWSFGKPQNLWDHIFVIICYIWTSLLATLVDVTWGFCEKGHRFRSFWFQRFFEFLESFLCFQHFSVPINSTIMVGLIWHFKPTMEVFLYIFMLF